MGCLDDGLVLGLGFSATTTLEKHGNNNNEKPKMMNKPCFEPSLSLGLSGETFYGCNKKTTDIKKVCEESGGADLFRQASPHSAVSSFSSGRVKRERDLSSEEIEAERVSSRVSDEDEDATNTRKKLRLTKEQSALLEESFKQHSTLNPVIN